MLLLLGVLAGFDTLLNGEYAFSCVWFCFSFLVATALKNSRYFKKKSLKTAPVVAYHAYSRSCFILVS